MAKAFSNPFRPGAGHPPPYLAGRTAETDEFRALLRQDPVLTNLVLTGLRGVGKTVLLDQFRSLALPLGWAWVGTDLSEAASVDEDRLALRLLTDVAVITAGLAVAKVDATPIGFARARSSKTVTLDYATLEGIYRSVPGLVSDKLKAVLAIALRALAAQRGVGLVFAYDEAQNMADHATRDQYPLSLLLEVFQSLQKQGLRALLVLVGLPTLFPKLVETRTFAERMFRVVTLGRLSDAECRDAIVKPVSAANCPVDLDERSVEQIVDLSGGYPYFVQFICRDVYDAFARGQTEIPVDAILRKLDSDFFHGRWARATDRQRELLRVIAFLDSADDEFTVQQIAAASKKLLAKPFSASHISQMLGALSDASLVYKNRHGRYSFAVPMMEQFIRRLEADERRG
ncbi:MAG: ATP-binding protein [Planctomycetes bacterium]|nr:ATP-binding protein [Planctomycetota bacterium]